jgi:tetrahydromethanopterin S-methyltransferase subunit C
MNHIANADKMVPAAFASGLLVGLILGVAGCDVASFKPKQTSAVDVVTQPVIVGDANDVRNTVDTAIKQVQNELWPWVVLLLGLGGLALVGAPLTLFGVAWFIRRWIKGESYVGQFDKILELKAKKFNGANGP